MTFLYQDPTFLNLPQFDPSAQPGSVLQPTAPADGGIGLSPAAAPPPAMQQQQEMTVAPPVAAATHVTAQARTPRDLAIAQMTGVRRFTSALGEAGAAMNNQQSPLDTQIAQVMARRKLQNDEQHQSLVQFHEYAQIAAGMEDGPDKQAFLETAGDALNSRTPGLGDALEAYNKNPNLMKVAEPYVKFMSPYHQAMAANNKPAFLAFLATKEGQAAVQAASFVPVDRAVIAKGSVLEHLAQAAPNELGLTPAQVSDFVRTPSMDGLRKINRSLPEGSAYKLTEPELQRMEENHDHVATGIGLMNDADHKKMLLKQAEIDANPKYIEIGAGKDAGGDLFVKAKPDPKGGPPTPEGTKYHKNPPMLAAPVAATTKQGEDLLVQPPKIPGQQSTILKDPRTQQPLAPAASSSKNLATPDAIKQQAARQVYFGIQPTRSQDKATVQAIQNEAAQNIKDLGLTPAEGARLPFDSKMQLKAATNLNLWGATVNATSDRLIKSTDIIIGLAEKIDPTWMQAINKGGVAAAKQFNNELANQYAFQLDVVRKDYARLQAGPMSAAMLPVEAAKRADEVIQGGLDVAGWRAIQETMRWDAQIAKDSITSEVKSLMDRTIEGTSRGGQGGQAVSGMTPLRGQGGETVPGMTVKRGSDKFTPAAPVLPKVKTVEEAMKLPAGTHFIDPNGRERIRP